MIVTVTRSIVTTTGFQICECAQANVEEEPEGDYLDLQVLTRALFAALPQMQKPKSKNHEQSSAGNN